MHLFKKHGTLDLFEQINQEHLRLVDVIKADPKNANKSDVAKFIMYGRALDMHTEAKDYFKIQLDFSDNSVKEIERIIDIYHSRIKEDIANETIDTISNNIGAYIGTVAVVQHEFKWKLANDEGTPSAVLSDSEGNLVNITGYVKKQILNGAADSVWTVYSLFVSKIAHEVTIEEVLAKTKKN